MNVLPMPAVRIATRASRLALWQAEHVAQALRRAAPGVVVEVVHIATTGDIDQAVALSSFGGVGVFTREVQKALLDGRADVAVHSLKDLPTQTAPRLFLAAVPPREDTDDALVLTAGAGTTGDLAAIRQHARIGTGSLRRQAQLRSVRPDLQVDTVRGNVETRLRKLDEGSFDALVLAVAGLNRLGLAGRIASRLAPPMMYPAVGQGALGIECREDDGRFRELLRLLDDAPTRARVTAERTLLARLRAGCHAPVGAATRLETGQLHLEAIVLSPNGQERIIARAYAAVSQAESLGEQVADDLLAQGADRLLSG